jgi:hypothetical protein
VGYKLVAANGEAIQQLRPTWTVVEGSTPTVRYERERIFLTEGLVQTCGTEGQLAAVLAWSLGQTYSARQARLALEAASHTLPPPEPFRVGHDGGGFNENDPLFQAQYRRELEVHQERLRAKQPLPEPGVVARQVLAQGGYSVNELEALQGLLKQLPTAK